MKIKKDNVEGGLPR